MIKQCEYCGNEFNARWRGAKYCSPVCGRASQRRRVSKVCQGCGKTFEAHASRPDRLYCSRECFHRATKAEKVEKLCPVCGKTFFVYPYYADRYTVCSRACRLAATRYETCPRCGKVFAVKKNNGSKTPYCSEECRRPPIISTCETCGKTIRVVPSSGRRFCSFACWRRFRGETTLEAKFRAALSAVGVDFVQESSIGRYSVDFAIPTARVVIEVDGAYWHTDPEKDARKDRYLKSRGWTVIRFGEREILDAADLRGLIVRRLEKFADFDLIRAHPPLANYVDGVV
jgi:very-short-patch-repair endonuclease/endogenous inhibitor of DNA gyrase (YacG/DUF329 family)